MSRAMALFSSSLVSWRCVQSSNLLDKAVRSRMLWLIVSLSRPRPTKCVLLSPWCKLLMCVSVSTCVQGVASEAFGLLLDTLVRVWSRALFLVKESRASDDLDLCRAGDCDGLTGDWANRTLKSPAAGRIIGQS